MSGFWTRTRRFMAAVWIGTAVLEVIVFEMARRTNNSWFLLLALALFLIPLAATDATVRWFGRPKRKRWKRHDVAAALAAGTAEPAAPPVTASPRPEV